MATSRRQRCRNGAPKKNVTKEESTRSWRARPGQSSLKPKEGHPCGGHIISRSGRKRETNNRIQNNNKDKDNDKTKIMTKRQI